MKVARAWLLPVGVRAAGRGPRRGQRGSPARLPGALAAVHGTWRTAVRRTATGTHERFAQLLRGAGRRLGRRPARGRARHLRRHGRPLGDLHARDPGARPALDPREVLVDVRGAVRLDDIRAATPEPVVFPLGEGGAWAYEVRFRVLEDAADVRAYLRADDLAVLLASNLASAATGRARVYPADPLTTPELVAATLEGLEEPAACCAAPLARRGAGRRRADRPRRPRLHGDPARAEFDEPQIYHHAWRGSTCSAR